MGIRNARTSETAALTELALRSKAHWPYDDAFLKACESALTVTLEHIQTRKVRVLVESGQVQGFYSLADLDDGEVELTDLWVDPARIGRGYGRELWSHAMETARCMGATKVLIHSDPYAKPFYIRMGAVQIGEIDSDAIPGRKLPLLSYALVT